MRVGSKDPKPNGKRAKGKKATTGDSSSEDETMAPAQSHTEVLSETPDQFIARINLYMQVHLARASGSKRGDYKDGLVYQFRKDLIHEFLKSTLLNKCQNADCGS